MTPLKITNAAWARLTDIAASRSDVDELRLVYRDGRVSCRRAVRRPEDLSMEFTGSPKVVLTAKVAKRLSGRTLDAPETNRGPRLRLLTEST